MVGMKRREFISLFGGAAAASPVAGWAQQGERLRHIGVLIYFAENDPEGAPRIAAFQQRLEKLGWRNGDNVRIDYRFAGGDIERMRRFAAELVALAPDVLLATNTPTLVALRQQTQTIPTVFVSVSDTWRGCPHRSNLQMRVSRLGQPPARLRWKPIRTHSR